ncbi:chlorophyll a/b-binding protein [Candidatus Cyanaurora vandensis]|uniref:chlorophyll a/b-binding protein n=1 Tax=Candidatus Cyanaurora vandensis TaxID=2714958 RepID=UPI00257C217D|nr:chlorophyll a/b-binding protein [Candidatus Cyanaurora vandensis]
MNTNRTTEDEAKFGFVPYAETLNGRLAMIGFVAALVLEVATGKGVLNFLGILGS